MFPCLYFPARRRAKFHHFGVLLVGRWIRISVERLVEFSVFIASGRQFSSRETRDAAPCSWVIYSAKRRNEKSRATRKVSTWFFRIDLRVDECINQREILKPYHPKKRGRKMILFQIFSLFIRWNYDISDICRCLLLQGRQCPLLSRWYRVRQKYLTIWQHSCEWNLWRGEFVFEHPSGETQSISVAMECWSVEHRAFAAEAHF